MNVELPEEVKYLKPFPRKQHFTDLIIESYYKRLLHAGVTHTQLRHEDWILHGRTEVKRGLCKCPICRRQEGGPYKIPPMAPWPKSRVMKSSPFTFVGLDYLGPLYIRESGKIQKTWVCLFTCVPVRAVDLELATNMAAEQLLLCLWRFIDRRGQPTKIVCGNASQFKLAKSTLDKAWQKCLRDPDVLSYTADKGISWQFIVEIAPWMGGLYERLVRLVKRILRKALGKLSFTYDQLLTILTKSEAVLNSRPLVFVGNDIDSSFALTSGDFLSLNPKTGNPEMEVDDIDPDYLPHVSTAQHLLETWKRGQKHLTSFWKASRDEYLLSLRERMQMHLKEGRVRAKQTPRVGYVVLFKENLPRGTWRTGKVTELVSSQDGETRAAKIQLTSKRILSRTLNMLYPLECTQYAEAQPATQSTKLTETYPMEGIRETSDTAEEQPLRQAAVDKYEDIRYKIYRKYEEYAYGRHGGRTLLLAGECR